MKNHLFTLVFSFFLGGKLYAQELPKQATSNIDEPSIKKKDSVKLDRFQLGEVHAHVRSFYSSTYNKNSAIEDAYALGGGLKFTSKPIHNLQLGMSGFLVYNLVSTDLSKPHPLSGSLNRYELALFDVINTSNKKNMDRLEELYIQYQKNKFTTTIGNQLLNTPFINLQDGRMRPNIVQGVWGQFTYGKNKFYAGWINRFSPGGTFEWFKTNTSIGVFSTGVNIDGTKSGYKNQLSTSGVALVGTELVFTNTKKIQIWNQLVANIFNTSMIQFDKLPTKSSSFYYGMQFIGQQVVNNGGNDAIHKTYFDPRQSALVFGARLGKLIANWDHSINYTRITKQGRYLMPREWGRDPFYTFLQGERSEGMGDMSAYMFKSKYSPSKLPLNLSFAAGYYQLADVKNYAMNKYGLPSYFQYNIDLRYAFSGFLKNWDAQLTYFHKDAIGNTYNEAKYYINKVDMGHFNFILNFHL